MKILKYKKSGTNKYILTIDNEEYLFYEDVLIKNNILLRHEVTNDEMKFFLEENRKYEAYYKALKYLTHHLRSVFEVKEYLIKNGYKYDYAIERLMKEGYINDYMYVKSYIKDKINFSNDGPYKIRRNLLKLNIDLETINKELNNFDIDLVDEKIEKYVNNHLKTNKSSIVLFKSKMLNNLINLGYSKEDINKVLNNLEASEDENYDKEYKKVYEKLSKKYEGIELEYKVKQKMYAKGYKKIKEE